MHRVGFEPTRIATSHLECDSLDRSDIYARYYFWVEISFTSNFDNNLLSLASHQKLRLFIKSKSKDRKT